MAGPDYTPPKLDNITIPDLFARIAQENPQRDVVQIIREYPDAPSNAIRIPWATFIQHSQNAAADLRARWGAKLKKADAMTQAAQPRKPGAPPVVVGLLGANGYEYYVNMIACMLNRWTALLISPKNSPEAIEHLLRTSKSTILVVDSNFLELGRVFEQSVDCLSCLSLASLEISAGDPAPALVPLTREQTEIEMEFPALYIHTSGSTGHPKIIVWNHRMFLGGARCRQRDGPADVGLHFYCVPPVFHAMGLFAYGMFLAAHANLITFVSSPTPKPPSALSLLAHIPFIKNGIVALPPSILEELYDMGPEAVSTVAEGTSKVIFAGAPLKKNTGDALTAAGLKLTAAYGATELGPASKIYLQEPANWEYIEFREGYNWIFLPVDGHPDLKELIVAPAEDCPAVINHENPRGYATNDIWIPHPSISNLWKHHSRKGNVMVLSNGEKTDIKQIEGLLLEDKRILYVQVFGAGRPLNGVILQPAQPFESAAEFVAQIQPTIDRANSILPRHSRLVPELIIVAPPGKPFATTDKGTVKTSETLDRYAGEIQSCYAILAAGGGTEWVFDGNITNAQEIKEFVRKAVKGVLGHDVSDVADFFEHGMDSLLAIRLRAVLLSVIAKTVTASEPVSRNITYTYPTINTLTDFVLTRASANKSIDDDNILHERILCTISRFSSDFVRHKPGSVKARGLVIALTGSTGSIGCSLLSLLLRRQDISKIYLLNRKGSTMSKTRQMAGFRSRGLDVSVLEEANIITYLDIDLSRKDLGLEVEEYDELRNTVTHIIHSAWELNFNMILESYERVHIAGVRHLIDLALSSPLSQTPRITFLSSAAACARYRGQSQAGQNLVPEEPIDDPSIPLEQGYAQSKYVSERVLVAATQAGLRATIIRIGQLSGMTSNGAWSLTEHVPIIIRSSIALGMIPDDLPPVRWIPSDVAASAVLKQTFGGVSNLEYFHIENPVPTPWGDIARAISDVSPRPLCAISIVAWLDRVAALDEGKDAEAVPAIRLLEFFQGLFRSGKPTAALGWQRSVKIAPELVMGSVTADFVKKYVAYQL